METVTKAVRDTVGALTGSQTDSKPQQQSAGVAKSKITKNDWILLTGASGFVAGHVLVALLKAGYKVKCTVRSNEKATKIRSLYRQYASALDFVIVKDIAETGAFDEAVKGVTGVIHTASPFVMENTGDNRKTLLEPAIQGTLNILNSIKTYNPDVSRVVVTSSFASVLDLSKGDWVGHTYTERDWNPVTYDEAAFADGAFAYCASKSLAEKAAWNFVKDPSHGNFSLATICPPMVYGPVDTETMSLSALNTSTADIYRLMNGSEKKVPNTLFYAWVDVRDVAMAHVRALEAAPKPNGVEDRFLTTPGVFSYKEICEIIARRFPHLVEAGLTPDPKEADEVPPHYNVDGSKSVLELQLAYKSLETSMVDTVESLLKLEKQEGKAQANVTV